MRSWNKLEEHGGPTALGVVELFLSLIITDGFVHFVQVLFDVDEEIVIPL